MLWEYATLGMGWWMIVSSILLLGVIAIAVWTFVRWATQPNARASLNAPVAASAADTVGQREARGEMDMAAEPKHVHVTLLTVPQCGYSEEAKATLVRLAHEYPLDIDMIALRSPAGDRLALQGGVLFPPGLFLDDEPFSYGRVSERALQQELARRTSMRVDDCNDATDSRLTMAYSRN